jgi:uncharacterized protein YbaR (Trm112 family)
MKRLQKDLDGKNNRQEHSVKKQSRKKIFQKLLRKCTDSVLSDILVCKECGKNYRITEAELSFYRRMGIPAPHLDFECRHQARMNKRNPRKLWHRKCMNDGCANEFETSYAPDRSEIVYCESCYQKEVM